jgi:hypothetical protein
LESSKRSSERFRRIFRVAAVVGREKEGVRRGEASKEIGSGNLSSFPSSVPVLANYIVAHRSASAQ